MDKVGDGGLALSQGPYKVVGIKIREVTGVIKDKVSQISVTLLFKQRDLIGRTYVSQDQPCSCVNGNFTLSKATFVLFSIPPSLSFGDLDLCLEFSTTLPEAVTNI